MNPLYRLFVCALVTATTVLALAQVRADDDPDQHNRPNRYVVTNLTSDIMGVAPNTDPVLQNAWGVAFTPGASPFWIADNATGCSTLYDGAGTTVNAPGTPVKLPLPGGSVPKTACQTVIPNNQNPPPMNAAPSGLVGTPTTGSAGFLVPGTTPPITAVF